MSVTSVRLSDELISAVESLAQKLDRSKNYIINQAIKDYVDRQNQEAQRWADTLEALENVSKGELVDGEQVSQWLESWGSENELSPPK